MVKLFNLGFGSTASGSSKGELTESISTYYSTGITFTRVRSRHMKTNRTSSLILLLIIPLLTALEVILGNALNVKFLEALPDVYKALIFCASLFCLQLIEKWRTSIEGTSQQHAQQAESAQSHAIHRVYGLYLE